MTEHKDNKDIGGCTDPDCEACSPYCDVCHGCGEVGCDGIESFLIRHVVGKTNCKHEQSYVDDIRNTYQYVESLLPQE